MRSALSSSDVGDFDFLLEYYSMSKRYKITVKYKHPRKVNQFAYSPDGENDLNLLDENLPSEDINKPTLENEELNPQLNGLDEETTHKFLDSIYEDIKSYLNGKPLNISNLRIFFPNNYPFIRGKFLRNNNQKGINFNGQLYAWPGDLAPSFKQSEWQRNVFEWARKWVNRKNSTSVLEETPFLEDLDESKFKTIIDDLVPKIVGENITTNLDGFDEYIRNFLPHGKFQTTGRSKSGNLRYTPLLPYITFGGLNYRVESYREWDDNSVNFSYLKTKLHEYLEKVKGAYPVLLKNKSNLENSLPGYKITLEYKLRDLGYGAWLQQNFPSYNNGKISTVELFNFLIGNNPTKNEFKLSSTNSDRFTVEENVINVQSPYGDKVYTYNYWDDFIVPELGRIDMLVETPTEKIAYECDGFFHYGVSRLNKNKNFAKQFLHDQMQNYFLEKVLGMRLIRRPLLPDWKKNIIAFIKDDLSETNSPLEKAAYNNYLFFK